MACENFQFQFQFRKGMMNEPDSVSSWPIYNKKKDSRNLPDVWSFGQIWENE